MSLDLFRYGYFVTAQCDLLRKDLIIYMLHEASQPAAPLTGYARGSYYSTHA